MNFSNQQIATVSLPSVSDIQLHPLNTKYLRVEMAWASILATVILIVSGTVLLLNPMDIPSPWRGLAMIVPVLVALLILVFTYYGYKKKAYALREQDIIFQRGLIWRSFTVVPFHRIQHVDVHQGPIERMMDLARLNVYTAGGSSSDVTIPGLSFDDAQKTKHFILKHNRPDEEE